MVPRISEGDVDSYLEWAIEEEFVNEIEAKGWITLKGDKIKRGFADRFCFGPGPRTVIIEFKRMGAPKKRRGEKLQNYYRAQFAQMRYETRRVEGMNESWDLLNELVLFGP